MNRFVAGFLIVAFSLTLALGLIESVLYIFPELIPIAYLIKFNKAVARDIASERGFAVQKEGLRIRRDDNGPPLVLPPADHVRIIPAHDLDIEIGAVELHLMDRNGMCNQSVPESASIVTLGDSFTWCTAVKSNATWTAVLQRELAISTYNVSKPREGLYEYLQMFKAIGTRLKPELMVMAFYEGNDLRDALEYST